MLMRRATAVIAETARFEWVLKFNVPYRGLIKHRPTGDRNKIVKVYRYVFWYCLLSWSISSNFGAI